MLRDVFFRLTGVQAAASTRMGLPMHPAQPAGKGSSRENTTHATRNSDQLVAAGNPGRGG